METPSAIQQLSAKIDKEHRDIEVIIWDKKKDCRKKNFHEYTLQTIIDNELEDYKSWNIVCPLCQRTKTDPEATSCLHSYHLDPDKNVLDLYNEDVV